MKRDAAGALAVGLAAGWNIANTGAAAGALAEAYRVSLPTVGLLTTALFVTHFASQIPGGTLIDRFGARPLAIASLLLIVVGNAAALSLASMSLAVASRVLIGVGTGIGFVSGSDWMRAVDSTPMAQGVYGGVSVGGGGLALVFVPLFEPPLDWRSPYLTALAVSLVALAICAQAGRPVARPAQPGSRAPLLRDRPLYLLAILHTASFGLSVIAANWVVSLLTKEGVSHAVAGVIGSFLLLGGLVTRPAASIVVRRRPAATRSLLIASMVAGGAGTALLATRSPVLVLACAAAVAGLAAGVPFATAFSGAQRLRPAAPASATGLVNAAATFTILVGVPLFGLTFLLPGSGRIGYAVVAVLWASAALAVPPALRVLRSAPEQTVDTTRPTLVSTVTDDAS